VPNFLPSYHHPIGDTNLNSLPYSQKLNHQRAYTPGGAIFLTLVTCDRPTLAEPGTVNRLCLASEAWRYQGGEKKTTAEFDEEGLV
jgi:hypothetical protein